MRYQYSDYTLDYGSKWTAWERESKHNHAGPFACPIELHSKDL